MLKDTECEGLCEVRVLWCGALWSKMDAEPKTRVANIQKRQRAEEHGCLLLLGQSGLSEGSYSVSMADWDGWMRVRCLCFGGPLETKLCSSSCERVHVMGVSGGRGPCQACGPMAVAVQHLTVACLGRDSLPSEGRTWVRMNGLSPYLEAAASLHHRS